MSEEADKTTLQQEVQQKTAEENQNEVELEARNQQEEEKIIK